MLNQTLRIMLLSALAMPALAYDLSQHLWQHRLLVLAADDPQDEALADRLDKIEQLRAGIDDRRLRIFHLAARSGSIDGRALSANDVLQLRRAFDIAPGQRQLLLIGLDGGIKRRADLQTGFDEIFAQIDAMPMRRAELRDRAGGSKAPDHERE